MSIQMQRKFHSFQAPLSFLSVCSISSPTLLVLRINLYICVNVGSWGSFWYYVENTFTWLFSSISSCLSDLEHRDLDKLCSIDYTFRNSHRIVSIMS